MIAFLIFAILAVIFWPLALLIGLGWVALLILRICFGITVSGMKAAAAAGIGAKMLYDSIPDSRRTPGNMTVSSAIGLAIGVLLILILLRALGLI